MAIDALTALAQPTRMRVLRHLLGGLIRRPCKPEIAWLCETPYNTMSTHLAVLTRAGLLSVTKESRSMLYRADLEGLRALVTFQTSDCCLGRPEICTPILGANLVARSCETESSCA